MQLFTRERRPSSPAGPLATALLQRDGDGSHPAVAVRFEDDGSENEEATPWVSAGLCLFGFAAPSAVLGSACSIGAMGVVLGPVVLVFVSIASAQGAEMLLALLDAHPRCSSFDDIGGAVGGVWARRAGWGLQMMNLVFYMPVALLMCADAVAGALDPSRAWAFGGAGAAASGCDAYWILAVSVICLATTQLRTLENASSQLSFLSLVCVALVCVIAVCLAVSHPASSHDDDVGGDNGHHFHAAIWFGNPDMRSEDWRQRLSGLTSLALGMSLASWAYCPSFLAVELACPAIRQQHIRWCTHPKTSRANSHTQGGGGGGRESRASGDAGGGFDGRQLLSNAANHGNPRFASLPGPSPVAGPALSWRRESLLATVVGTLRGDQFVPLSPAAAPFRKAIWLSAALSVITGVTVGIVVVQSWGWDVSDPLLFGVTGGYSAWADGKEKGTVGADATGGGGGSGGDDDDDNDDDADDNADDHGSWPWPKDSGPARSLCVFWFAAGAVSYALDSIAVAVVCARVWAPGLSRRIRSRDGAQSSGLEARVMEDDWDSSLATAFHFLLITLPPFVFAVAVALLVPSLLCMLAVVTALTVPWANNVYPAVVFHAWLQRGMPGAFHHGEERHRYHISYDHTRVHQQRDHEATHRAGGAGGGSVAAAATTGDAFGAAVFISGHASAHLELRGGDNDAAVGIDARRKNPPPSQQSTALPAQQQLQSSVPLAAQANSHASSAFIASNNEAPQHQKRGKGGEGSEDMQHRVRTRSSSSLNARMHTVDSAASFFSATESHPGHGSSDSDCDAPHMARGGANNKTSRHLSPRRKKRLQGSNDELSSFLYDTGFEEKPAVAEVSPKKIIGNGQTSITSGYFGPASGKSQLASGNGWPSSGSLEADDWGQHTAGLSSHPSWSNMLHRSSSTDSDVAVGLLPAVRDHGDGSGAGSRVDGGDSIMQVSPGGSSTWKPLPSPYPPPQADDAGLIKRVSSGSMGYEDAGSGGGGIGGVTRRAGRRHYERTPMSKKLPSFATCYVACVGVVMVLVCVGAAVGKLVLPEFRGEVQIGCGEWQVL